MAALGASAQEMLQALDMAKQAALSCARRILGVTGGKIRPSALSDSKPCSKVQQHRLKPYVGHTVGIMPAAGIRRGAR